MPYWLIILWIICGILAYGQYYAYFQTEFPEAKECGNDRQEALFISLLGPIALFAVLMTTHGKHGFKYR